MTVDATSGREVLGGIAVVGMAGRFPAAADVDEFWANLCAGRECLMRLGADQLLASGVSRATLEDSRHVPVNGVLADADLFDADFFRMSPREAAVTDPQQRVFLELSWRALEHAGYDPARYAGSIGVYAGCGMSSYLLHNLLPNRAELAGVGELRARMSTGQEYLATRVSYKLDLRGPSVSVNTACSTSLVAVHLACDALLNFQCDMALAGGVSIQVPQCQGYLYEEGGILSPDGRCRAFDAAARGTVSGNGGAAVVLKRLEDALTDGDSVYAVIRGSAVNNDGADKAGYTAPSVTGQARVIAEALAVAGVEAESIGYVEAHGTGTPLGDPIEVAALTQAFRRQTSRARFCALGSVKANVGHLDEAAGVAGLIKAVLSLHHRRLPPSLHFERPNPNIEFDGSPFFVNARGREWAAPYPRRAGVSSFGIGGTNAHVVLEEAAPAPPASERPGKREASLLVLSARTPAALDAAARNIARHLESNPEVCLADVAFTLAAGRRAFTFRRAYVCRTHADAVAQLRSEVGGEAAPQTAGAAVFLFPGQGSQYAGMADELYRAERFFRETIDECAEILARRCGFDLPGALAGGSIDQTAVAQPTLFATEYAVAALLGSWGVKPQAMLGHSLGEYVAATLAGVFSLEDALALVAARGRLMQATAPGAMIAVPLGEAECAPLVGRGLSLAALNAPSSCVLSGTPEAVEHAESELAARGVTPVRLRTSHAFHSPSMEPVLGAFREQLERVALRAPATPFISNLTGLWITPEQATNPDYWVRHLREPVHFSEGVARLSEFRDAAWIEVGPGSALASLVGRNNGATRPVLRTLPPAGSKGEGTSAAILNTLGRLWAGGADVEWEDFFKGERRQRVPLPTYPFERKRYWIGDPARPSQPQPLTPAVATTREASGDNPHAESWFYATRWTRVETTPDARRDGAWVVFGGREDFAAEVGRRLKEAGARVTLVRHGGAFELPCEGEFVLPLHDAGAHALLWQRLGRPGWSTANLLLSAPGPEAAPHEGVLQLLALIQGLQDSSAERRLMVVTRHAQAVLDDEVVEPAGGMFVGAMAAVAAEYPNLDCRVVDLGARDSAKDAAAGILACMDRGADGLSLAVRVGSVWQQGVEPVVLADAAPAPVRERGTYLITGGLGSMGLAFAEHLARTARARLALVSRTGLDAEALEDGLRFPLLSDVEAIKGIERAARAGAGVASLDLEPGLEPLLERHCSSLIWEFVSRGLPSARRGARCSVAELAARLGLLPKFRKFLDALLRLLAGNGVVARRGEELEVLAAEVEPPAELAVEIATRFPSYVPLAGLISHCVSHYPEALSGAIPAVTVLYPDGTPRWFDGATAAIPRYTWEPAYLRAAADLVERLAAGRLQPLRILEVGGGTGSLTQLLTGLIAGGKVDYHFTDVSPVFVARAEEAARGRGLGAMRFGRLDISRPPGPQGFDSGLCDDLVVAYNVVHATPHVAQTAGHLRSLLAGGGALLLVETVKPPCWIDLIWGLCEGWWAFEDSPLRTDSPLLSLDKWEEVLAGSGFGRVTAYPREAGERRRLDAGLIVAHANNAGPRAARARAARESIARIEAAGGEVCVVAADVSDAMGVARAVASAESRFGRVNGVIHAAGVLGQTLIRQQTPDEVLRVLGPKVAGTLKLEAALGERPLDFFIICSSMSSTEPMPGQFAYGAANAFLDSFARARAAKRPGLTVSIDWGFWQELGMIESANVPESVKRAVSEETKAKGWSLRGVEIFERVLRGRPPAQLLVSPTPPRTRASGAVAERLGHPILRACLREKDGLAVFTGSVSESDWVVGEHRVGGRAVLPATAYLDLAVTAFWQLGGRRPAELTEVFFLTPMAFAVGEKKEVRLVLEESSGGHDFRVFSQSSPGVWQEHARGEVRPCGSDVVRQRIDLGTACQPSPAESDGDSHAPEGFWERVKDFPPHWRNIVEAAFKGREAEARFQLEPRLAGDLGRFSLHPALLDTATGFMAVRAGLDAFVPFSFRRVCVFDRLPESCASALSLAPDDPTFEGSVTDARGEEVVHFEGYTLRRADGGAAGPGAATPENAILEITTPGELRTLAYRPAVRTHPRPGEVEIAVRAAGLNFVEALYALGLLHNFTGGRVTLGQECAGVVTRVGEGVGEFKPGDEVIAYGPACFSIYTNIDTEAVAPKPPGYSFEEAAGLPAAFVTAWYSLVRLARLEPGERVLIHAAAGGVGLAAVRIAQHVGAEIYATAGTDAKRDFLRGLAIEHVMDSRSLAFAEEVRRATDGEGVDVVLNSLGGEFITKSLGLLRRHGRFLELGKRDIFRDAPLGMGAFSNFISFFAVDVGPDVPGFASVWRELNEHFRSRSFGHVPHTSFPAASAQEAFEYMAGARHTGKVVLSFEDAGAVLAAATSAPVGRAWEEIMRRNSAGPDAHADEPAVRAAPPACEPTAGDARRQTRTGSNAPATETEKALAALWEKMLGVSDLGVDDDFFELQGDSLLAAQIMSRLRPLFEVKLPLSLIFDFPTVRALASQIDARLAAREPSGPPEAAHWPAAHPEPAGPVHPIEPAPPQAHYPLTRAQKRLWILAQNPEASMAYNMCYALRLVGALDYESLRRAFSYVVERHESLRTAFVTVGAEPRQRVSAAEPFHVPLVDLRGAADVRAAAERESSNEARTPFRLDRPPLLRARLMRVADDEHLLLVSLHHLVSDGRSLNVLMRELDTAYTAFSAGRAPDLAPLVIQYKDFAVWQQEQLGGAVMRAHRDYWLDKLGGELPALELPLDRPRPPIRQFGGGQVVLRLPAERQESLRRFCREQGATMFMLLAATTKILLHQLTGQPDIIVGSPIAGRERPEVEGQIGYYLNNVVLRDTVSRGEPFAALLRRVRATVTEALAHQSYPFDRLVEELTLKMDLGRSPLFDVQLNLMPGETPPLRLGNLAVSGAAAPENSTTMFDLNFMFSDGASGLGVEIGYSAALFDEPTMARLGENLMRLLSAVADRPDSTVRNLCELLDGRAAADKEAFLASALELTEEF